MRTSGAFDTYLIPLHLEGGAANEPGLVIAEHGGVVQCTVAVDVDGSELAHFHEVFLEQQLVHMGLSILHRQQHNVLLLRILVVHTGKRFSIFSTISVTPLFAATSIGVSFSLTTISVLRSL